MAMLLQYSCLENSRDSGGWWATVPCGCKDSDTTVRTRSLVCLFLKTFHKSVDYWAHLNSECLVVLNINYLLPQKILFDYRISIERGCVVVIRRARNLGIKVGPCSEFVVVFQVSLSEKWGNPIICRVPLSSENNGNIFKKERHVCHCKCQRYS